MKLSLSFSRCHAQYERKSEELNMVTFTLKHTKFNYMRKWHNFYNTRIRLFQPTVFTQNRQLKEQ